MENFLIEEVILDLKSKFIFILVFPLHLVRDVVRISATILDIVLEVVFDLMEFALPIYITVNDKPLSYFIAVLPKILYLKLFNTIDNFLAIVSYNIRAIVYGEKLTTSIEEIRRRGF